MQPQTSSELQQFLNENQIEAEILFMAEHTPTVPDAAQALGVREEQIIKSLVFVIKGEPLLVMNNGTAKVDRRAIATHLGVGRKQIKFARAEQALEITGFIVGSMPPFGHLQKLRTLVDPAVMELETVYGGGGDLNAMMRLSTQTLLQVSQAEVVPVSE